MAEKWPPLDPGTRVKTNSRKTPDKEWTPEALVARKWGATGTIVMHHDSHGLCYDVRHDDGTEGCYDPDEFDVLPEVMKDCCRKTINTPEVEDFLKAVAVEAAHQRDRWKATDPIKDESDWYWLIGWLGGKAIMDPHEPGDTRTPEERKKHRIVTIAAAAYNWHSAVKANSTE